MSASEPHYCVLHTTKKTNMQKLTFILPSKIQLCISISLLLMQASSARSGGVAARCLTGVDLHAEDTHPGC